MLIKPKPASVIVMTLLMFALPLAPYSANAQGGSIELNAPPSLSDRHTEWQDVPSLVIPGANGFVARKQSRSLGAKDGSHGDYLQRAVFESPWGETAEVVAIAKGDTMYL